MHKNPRLMIVILITSFVFPSACFAQNPFTQQNPMVPQTQKHAKPVSQVPAEAQKHFNKAVQLQKAGKLDAAISEFLIVKKMMPKQPAVILNLGICYMRKQSLPKAESAFREVLAIQPTNGFARLQLTRILMTRGKNAEALSSAKKLVSLNPKDYSAQFMLGVMYTKAKNTSGAAAAFKSALAIRPSDNGARYNLGYCQVNMKKYAEARKTFDILLKAIPNDPQANVLAGIACEQTGDKAAAIVHYDRVAWKGEPTSHGAILGLARVYSSMGETDKYIEVLKRGVKLEKDDYDLNISLGRALLAKKQYKEAEPYLLAARKAESNAFVNMNLALNYSSLDKNKEAEQYAQAALKLAPKDKQAIEVHAYILEKQQKTTEAIAAYRKWENYYPQDPTPNIRIANDYLMQGKSNMAYADYEKAMKKKPKDAGLMVTAASCLKQMNKPDDAIKLLQKAVAIDSKSESAYMSLAETYMDQKKTDLAIEQYKKVLGVNPKSVTAMQRLAMAYDGKNDYKSEIDIYRKLYKLDSKDTLSAMSIPRLYEKLGDLDMATAESKKIVDANQKNTSLRTQYGDLLSKKKDWAGALEQYAELIKSDDARTKCNGYVLTGGVQESMGKPDDAVASYKKSLETMPAYTKALDALSKIYESKKQQDEFYTYLKSLIEPGKEDLPYRYYLNALKKAGKTDEAVKTLEEINQKTPGVIPISSTLAEAYTASGAKEKAIEQYKIVLAKDKNNAWANRSLGDLYKSMDSYSEAASCYTEVVKTMPYDTNTQQHLGDCYTKLGKKTEALAAYKEVLKYDPINKDAKDAIQALGSTKPMENAPEAASKPVTAGEQKTDTKTTPIQSPKVVAPLPNPAPVAR